MLLDVHLPDMSGADVLSAVKSDARTRHLPVVILSADATEGASRRLLDLGAEAFLTKPLDIAQLTSVLDELGAHRGAAAGTPDATSSSGSVD